MDWFTLLQSIGIISGLIFTAVMFRADSKARRLAIHMEITKQHQANWSHLIDRPELARILKNDDELLSAPISLQEEMFLTLLVNHLNASFYAMNDGLLVQPEGLRMDIDQFFALPIPKRIWLKLKPLLNKEFVNFVEEKG